ncbi:MAG: hypothetical protein D6781_03995, partial [Verrucomicrobia bacterium]
MVVPAWLSEVRLRRAPLRACPNSPKRDPVGDRAIRGTLRSGQTGSQTSKENVWFWAWFRIQ